MKLSLVVLVVVSLFASTLPSGQHRAAIQPQQPQRVSPAVLADGNPAPPFPPKPEASTNSAASWLSADGNPAPPFPPKPDASVISGASWMMADGNPAPPFPPRPETLANLRGAWLIADGNPAPPFPPSTALPVTA